MKKCYHIIAVAFATMSVLVGLGFDLDPTYLMGGRQKILVYAMPILVLFIEMIYQMRHAPDIQKKQEIQHAAHRNMFIVYLIAAMTLLFLGNSFRRNFADRNIWEAQMFSEKHFKMYCNLRPFKTIRMYLRAYKRHSMSVRLISANILGNLAAFMPCAIFMPVIFPKMRKFRFFLVTITGMVVLVETIQFLTMVGQADIDDVLLNVSGACILYAFRPVLHRLEGKYADYYLTEQQVPKT